MEGEDASGRKAGRKKKRPGGRGPGAQSRPASVRRSIPRWFTTAQPFGEDGPTEVNALLSNIPGLDAAGCWTLVSPLLKDVFGECAPDTALHLLHQLNECPAPRRAFLAVETLLRRLDEAPRQLRDDVVEAFRRRPASGWEMFVTLASHSEALTSRLSANLNWLAELIKEQEKLRLPDSERIREKLAPLREAPDFSAALGILRRVKSRMTIPILLCDVLGAALLEEVTGAISELADACIDAAVEYAARAVKGDQSEKIRFSVIALGKLGGRELNYSSDIDLVFVFEQTRADEDSRRSRRASDLAQEIGRKVIRLLAETTSDGFVHRVDMRLRPYGEPGPLAWERSAFMRYYFDEGRTWERQILLKARPAAGDLEMANELRRQLTPFIHPRYMSQDEMESVRELKRIIEARAARSGLERSDIKLGAGGIRDIEFIVQMLQLVHGGAYPSIRTPNTLECIERLAREKIIEYPEAAALRESYEFFRRIEHRIQVLHDLQSHRIPDELSARADLFRRLAPNYEREPWNRLEDTEAVKLFDRRIEEAREKTREVFRKLFTGGEPGNETGELSELLLFPDEIPELVAPLLRRYGFKSPQQAVKSFFRLRDERSRLLASPRARRSFGRLAPRLLEEMRAAGDPDRALIRFERVVDSIGARTGFYQLLLEQKKLMALVVQMCAWSEMLTRILEQNPGMFDEIIEVLLLDRDFSATDLRRELDMLLTGGDLGPSLRAFKASHVLRIGCRDLIFEMDLDAVGESLTDLAEAVLREQLEASRREIAERRGLAEVALPPPAILGLGKLGGREMNYGSDLDVLFVCDPERHAGRMPESDYIAVQTELVQHVIREMERMTPQGALYALDARLRPGGRSGALMITLEGFIAYADSGGLADWERLALTRARPVAGHEPTAERIMHAVHSRIFHSSGDKRKQVKLDAAVLEMRARLEASAGKRDIKRGSGGMVDIEFIAQYMQLIEAGVFPRLRRTNTAETLRLLVKYGRMNAEVADELLESHRFLRMLENRIRIVHGAGETSLPGDSERLEQLARRIPRKWKIDSGAELLERYEHITRSVREIFEKLLGKRE